MRYGWVRIGLVAAVVGLIGCGGGEPDEPDSGEAMDTGADSMEGICCPIEIGPGTPCGCWRIGGHAPTMAECPVHCDGANYSERTDEHGCSVLDYSGFGSCLPGPDAGPR